MRFTTGNAEAQKLGKHLAAAVDHGLKHQRRDPKDPPTDGQLAVMIIFLELDRLGFFLGPKARR